MNIIRTKTVDLTVVPAIAYKQKLPAGGAGIKILRLDMEESAVATLDRRTGAAVPYGKSDEKLFPPEAFYEAVALTAGLPYSTRGNVKINVSERVAKEEEAWREPDEQPIEVVDMTNSDEYKAIVEKYSDEKGRLNYTLMNKDFIQFAAKSKTVSDMAANKALTEDILVFVIKNRAAYLANKKESLDDQSIIALIDTLDEIDPRSAFKELKNHINKQLAKK